MKQLNAFAFATLRISAVLAMLWILPVGPVSAIPIQMPLTGGRITMDILPPNAPAAGYWFDVHLENPRYGGFRVDNVPSAFWDGLGFTGSPNTCCSAQMVLSYAFDFVGYLDAAYHLYAVVDLFTSSIDLGPVLSPGTQLTLGGPFTLSGTVHGGASFFPYPSVDFDVIGGGTFGAVFESVGESSPAWVLQHLNYDLVPQVPEPATWVLVVSGLFGAAGRRRSTRLPQSAPSSDRYRVDLYEVARGHDRYPDHHIRWFVISK